MRYLATYIAVSIWNLAVLGGTAYLVGWRDWSAWWFLASMCLIHSVGFRETKADE